MIQIVVFAVSVSGLMVYGTYMAVRDMRRLNQCQEEVKEWTPLAGRSKTSSL